MPLTFYLFLLLYPLIFAQAKVLQTQGDLILPDRLRRISIMVNLGWICFATLFIYYGIEYSWVNTLIGFVVSAIISGTIVVLFPPIYLICRLWPVQMIIILVFEFFL
jgi:hypothetical protein